MIKLLIFRITTYVRYLLRRKERHGVHSPYVYDLMTLYLPKQREFACFEDIEYRRHLCLSSAEEIEITDFGAGSIKSSSKKRRISSIASTSAKPKAQAQLLFKLVALHRPSTLLELGTNLGLTTSYLSLAAPSAKTISIEGSEVLASLAIQNLQHVGARADVRIGRFEDLLPGVLEELKSIDFAFLDGNHRKDATLHYWNQIKPYCRPNTLIVVDDIYWSEDMSEAWEVIKSDPAVSLTLDFYWFGVVYFRTDTEKQEYVLRMPR